MQQNRTTQPQKNRATTPCKKRYPVVVARLYLVCAVMLLSACSSFSVHDQPLKQWSPEQESQIQAQIEGDRSKELAVLLAFSGGGTRAAAFSFGVLKELADTQIVTANGKRSLLQEVDIISSVSGGSFTAAYYGLYGDKIFTDFEPQFLHKNVEGILLRKVFLNPFNWLRLMSWSFGRSELVAEYYDEELFKKATIADMKRADAPLVVMNASDLGTGDRISFVQTDFNVLCLDLDSYPISRAVAASSAVPVILSPVTLENFAGSCGFQPAGWLAEALKDDELTQRKIEARELSYYLDKTKRPWLHLVDGGVADNVGLRAYYEGLSMADEPGTHTKFLHNENMRHVIIIVVNAHARRKSDWLLERYAPGIFEVIESVAADQVARYSVDTIQLVHQTFRSWVKKNSTPEHPLTFHFVEVSFDYVQDDSEREFLNNVGTNFDISVEQSDRLIAAARQILRESKQFKSFLELLRGEATGTDSRLPVAEKVKRVSVPQ